ncbi:MAG: Ppx/GppA phosphatase family protein [Solirubrobacterales bacterium]
MNFAPTRPPADATYAALDLGTNNCRMLIARPLPRGFRVIDAYSRITRLGEGLAVAGRLSEEAMARTIDALRACADKMARHRVGRYRLVATEACRRAANCMDFAERVAEETGLVLDIIAAHEEAALALDGCASLLEPDVPWALVFDIGGGSTELLWVDCGEDGHRIEGVQSLPVGVVTLAEQHAAALHEPAGYERVVADLAAAIAPFEQRHAIAERLPQGEVQMLGTSGTVTTLGALHLDLERYERHMVDGLDLDFGDIATVTRRLAAMSRDQRARHPCIGPERADLVVAGCAILEAVCRQWPLGRLRVADRGVREGVLHSLMRQDTLALGGAA